MEEETNTAKRSNMADSCEESELDTSPPKPSLNDIKKMLVTVTILKEY